jgi:enoyl-CoA hydratase/carnithine racemase
MTGELEFSQKGQIGVITLNRPTALNALTLEMICVLQRQLSAWKADDAINAVIIRAVPGNAFCAGGDVRWLYQMGRESLEEQLQFFWHEYRLNHFIHHLGKPYIALMDGITMGGGVGVSLHGSFPVASERFVFAMPETSIGFFPDIGSSYLLTRCANSLGVYLGLTGNRLNAHEAAQTGLVKYVIPSEQMESMIEALVQEDLSIDAYERVGRCLNAYSSSLESSDFEQFYPLIEQCFSSATVEEILGSLDASQDEWAKKTKGLLAHKSPFSLKLTLAQLQKARGLTLDECLQMDFNLVNHFMRDHDFYEGVRALLVDKDKNPQWKPASLEAVTQEQVAAYFEPLSKGLEFLH